MPKKPTGPEYGRAPSALRRCRLSKTTRPQPQVFLKLSPSMQPMDWFVCAQVTGKRLDVNVADHVYDLSKLKAGDKLKVDFFQPDEANPKVSAAGIWPVQPTQ